MSKYHAKKTTVDGITFDSKKEAERYCELKLLEKAGEITHLTLQPVFELQPKFKKNGKMIRAITYTADFMYCEEASGGGVVVEDVKGMRTQQFELRRKMFEYVNPDLTLKIV